MIPAWINPRDAPRYDPKGHGTTNHPSLSLLDSLTHATY